MYFIADFAISSLEEPWSMSLLDQVTTGILCHRRGSLNLLRLHLTWLIFFIKVCQREHNFFLEYVKIDVSSFIERRKLHDAVFKLQKSYPISLHISPLTPTLGKKSIISTKKLCLAPIQTFFSHFRLDPCQTRRFLVEDHTVSVLPQHPTDQGDDGGQILFRPPIGRDRRPPFREGGFGIGRPVFLSPVTKEIVPNLPRKDAA